jgi:Fe-S-cluster containining protein
MSLSPREFKCTHCGSCCWGPIPVTDDDLLRWAAQSRADILARVLPREMVMGPRAHDPAERCPFLVALPAQGIALCGIHSTKPAACVAFPSVMEDAMRVGCPGLRRAVARPGRVVEAV